MVDSLNLTAGEISLLRDKVPKRCSDVELYAKGKRGVIFKADCHGRDVVIKIPLSSSDANSTALLEARYLEKVNQLGIGPLLYDFSDDYVVMEFVDGVLIGDFLKSDSLKTENLIHVLLSIFDQLVSLDRYSINKFELTNPYKHIIIKNNFDPVLIDFERARHTIRPKNVTQFAEYLTGGNILPLLQKHDLLLDIVRFKAAISDYVKTGNLFLEQVL